MTIHRCGVPNLDGRPCQNRVRHPGDRCHAHGGGDGSRSGMASQTNLLERVPSTQVEVEDARGGLYWATAQARAGTVQCAKCGRNLDLRTAFRCFHCGLWFGQCCGAEHFGPRPTHHLEES